MTGKKSPPQNEELGGNVCLCEVLAYWRCGMACLMVVSLSIATVAGSLIQQVAPTGNWQSVRNETYSSPLHPVVTGAEFYLNINIANDGSFRGQWGEYTCVPS